MDGEIGAESREPLLRVDIVSLFPALFQSWLAQGVVSRAMTKGLVQVSIADVRPHGVGRHLVTDDYPFGGGPGMVMKPEPLFAAVEALDLPGGTPIILLAPAGRTLTQPIAVELSRLRRFALVAGHYEGVDQRVREHLVTDELSIGDYVLSCGELAAMVVTDAVVRLVPGALAEGSSEEESFSSELLEYPQYTRPATFREWHVPPVLLSGNHAQIEGWRREQALRLTWSRRPEMVARAQLTARERVLVQSWEENEL